MRLYDGDTFEKDGQTFRVTFPYDECSDMPWEREDGHGHVTGWERRDKQPGERILCEDKGSRRFYSMSPREAVAAWGIGPVPVQDDATGRVLSAREYAAKLIDEDYERLRRFCAEQWCYVGVVVELLDEDEQPTGYTASLWGIESEATEYLAEVACELADEALAESHKHSFCVTCHKQVS